MYNSLKIENFRAFKSFEVLNLGQVNLFVGRNNTGKTAILEALELLASKHEWSALFKSPKRRNEYFEDLTFEKLAIDIKHLFNGHYFDVHSWFKISGIKRNKQEDAIKLAFTEDIFELIAQLESTDLKEFLLRPVEKIFEKSKSLFNLNERKIHPLFLSSTKVHNIELRYFWDSIVATPAEEKVYEALSIVVPNIERIVFTSSQNGDIFIKLKNTERLPLGSMGEGIYRLLSLAIYLVKSEGKCLLIDEIDTGLHYSVMEELWYFIVKIAQQLNVQVFATTHNGDCVRALAWLQTEQAELAKTIALYRIESNMTKAIRYSAEELEIAARHHIEVRG